MGRSKKGPELMRGSRVFHVTGWEKALQEMDVTQSGEWLYSFNFMRETVMGVGAEGPETRARTGVDDRPHQIWWMSKAFFVNFQTACPDTFTCCGRYLLDDKSED